MRIPYAPSTPPPSAPSSTAAIYSRLSARRAPRPLLALDRALLHNPAIADGYNSFLGAIRTAGSLPVALMELAICRVAVLNGAVFEWESHAPLAMKAGVSREKLEEVLKAKVGLWEGASEVLGEDERLVLELTDQSTRKVRVEEELVEKLKERFGDQQTMELVITVGAYNMVSRFLVGLDVAERNGQTMEVPTEIKIIA